MTLRQITLIALLGTIIALVLSLQDPISMIIRSGRPRDGFWLSLAIMLLRDGSLTIFLATLYSRSAPRP